MWLILGPVLVAIVGVILIVIRMAYQQREQDRQAGRRDDDEDTPVFMIGFELNKKRKAEGKKPVGTPPPVNVIDWTRK